MRQLIIDGSCKEIALGAGIVEVDGLGFINTHTFSTFHVRADAVLAEIYAFDCALQLIQDKGNTERHFEVYTDHIVVHKLFNEEFNCSSHDLYIDNLKKQVILLKKFTKFDLLMKNKNIESFAKMAHLLSREYLEHQTTSKVINQSISLKIRCI